MSYYEQYVQGYSLRSLPRKRKQIDKTRRAQMAKKYI